MKSFWSLEKAGYLLAAALLASSSFACGGGDASVDCGDDEVFYDGECIDVDTFCGPNSSYVDGECAPDAPVECGANTQLDPNSNECVLTEESCTGNTAYDSASDSCVATDEVCADGTVFDADARLCYPSIQCQPGDVAVEGFCLSPAEALAANADVNAGGANSNPDEDGTPHTLPVGGIGETTVFTGSIIDPAEVKDGEIAQHYDFFSFSAQEGDWFEISVQSLGLPSPHFEVWLSSESGLQWYRESSYVTGSNKARQIVVPRDATVVVKVGPEGSFLGAPPVGGEGWDYVGSVAQIEVPSAASHDFDADGNLSGTLGRLDSNFYQVAGASEGDRISFTLEELPANANVVVQAWASPTTFIGEYSSETFNVEVPAGEGLFLLADWDFIIGAYGLDYEVSARRIIDIAPESEYSQTITADAHDVLEIRQTNQSSASVIVTVTGDSGTLLEGTLAAGAVARYLGLEAGTYTVTYANTGSSPIENFVGNPELIAPTPITDLSATISGDSHESDRFPQSYYLVELTETTHVETTLVRLTGSGWARLFLYSGGERLFRHDSYAASSPISTLFTFNAGQPYIIRVGNDAGGTTPWPFTYDMSFIPFTELDSTTFTIGPDAILAHVSQVNAEEEAAMIRIFNEDGQVVQSGWVDSGEALTMSNPEAGDYTAILLGNDLTSGSLDVMVYDTFVADVQVSNGVDPATTESTPYPAADGFVTYQNSENAQVGDSSYREFTVAGASSLIVIFSFRVENNFDYLVVKDLVSGNEVFEGTGPSAAGTVHTVAVSIPSNQFSVGVDSDGSVMTEGWRIDGIVAVP